MNDQPYNNRELDHRFKDLHDKLDDLLETANQVVEQTTKTNGRVTKLERNLLIVACVVGTILFIKGAELVEFFKILFF